MEEFAERVMALIKHRREVNGETREEEAYINGLKRAVVIALGQEGAERVFAAHDEAY